MCYSGNRIRNWETAFRFFQFDPAKRWVFVFLRRAWFFFSPRRARRKSSHFPAFPVLAVNITPNFGPEGHLSGVRLTVWFDSESCVPWGQGATARTVENYSPQRHRGHRGFASAESSP